MEEELSRLHAEATEELATIDQESELESCRIKYLGRKGQFTGLMRQLSQVPPEDRPRLGKLANQLKKELEEKFTRKAAQLAAAGAGSREPRQDLSLPGRFIPPGKAHPVTQIMEEVCSIFVKMGFTVAEGPDVELDYYNFEALNIPQHHPARDMHDTFYISDGILLRTQTSPMQIRAMENQPPPLRIIAPGKVYRCDSDITHTPMFHQVEGFLVDRKVSFADLKGLLSIFCQKMFDEDIPIRFRPSFFPFTEPSAEVDIG